MPRIVYSVYTVRAVHANGYCCSWIGRPRRVASLLLNKTQTTHAHRSRAKDRCALKTMLMIARSSDDDENESWVVGDWCCCFFFIIVLCLRAYMLFTFFLYCVGCFCLSPLSHLLGLDCIYTWCAWTCTIKLWSSVALLRCLWLCARGTYGPSAMRRNVLVCNIYMYMFVHMLRTWIITRYS